MGDKRLGRGFQDLSNIFLSTSGENTAAGLPKAWPACTLCAHFISACLEPTCRIYTFDFERHGVGYRAKIDPETGGTCGFFQPRKTGPEKTGRMLEPAPDTEEVLILNRRVTVKKNALTRKTLEKILLGLLDEGYEIQQVVLEKIPRTPTSPGHPGKLRVEISVTDRP